VIEGQLARIEREAHVSQLLEVLASRLEPTDLQSLLLEVYRRRAAAVTPKRLLEQYEQNRFVSPSTADPRMLVEVDRLAWSLLPDGYEPLELSPLCPLGTNSTIASVSQNKVVSTSRNTEVVADSTNVMALECATRRRRLRQLAGRRHEPVRLAASQRLTRAQVFEGPRTWAHFRVLALCAAGRDEGSLKFETMQLVEQIAFHVRIMQDVGRLGRSLRDIRVEVTDLTDGRLTDTLDAQLLRPLSARFPDVACSFDPARTAGRGYYEDVCFKVSATEPSGDVLAMADGGSTNWTRRLLSDRKERLVISGISVERLCPHPHSG
jgi:hypothetical protein